MIKKITTTLAVATMVSTTACTSFVGQGIDGRGRVLINADAAGMQAFSDTLNGLVTNGKASPNAETPAWVTRRHYITMKTLKSAPSMDVYTTEEKAALDKEVNK